MPRERPKTFYWRHDYFQMLKDVAAQAEAVPEWAEYAAFCRDNERGLRKSAFAALERFIEALEKSPFFDRKRFTSWIMNAVDDAPGCRQAIPHPLQRRIIEPTLLEWTLQETNCAEPHRWLGAYDDLVKAIELDPDDQIAIRNLIRIILGGVGYASHELPAGYLGDPRKDLDALERAERLMGRLKDDPMRASFLADSAELRAEILKHLER